MYVFLGGSPKTAQAGVKVSPGGTPSQVEIWLGVDEFNKAATSGLIDFVSTGGVQSVSLPVIMPLNWGTYHVYLDLYAGGILVKQYQGADDIVIPEGSIPGPIVWG